MLAPELYSVSLVERPPVAEDELVDAVRWQIQENVEFPVDTATLDVFPLPDAATRDRPMVFVVAMQTEFLKVLLGQGARSRDSRSAAWTWRNWPCATLCTACSRSRIRVCALCG